MNVIRRHEATQPLPHHLEPTHTAHQTRRTPFFTALALSAAVSAAVTLAGCKQKAVSDDQLTSQIQQQLAADSALTGQTIQPVVAQGVVTLNGTVANDAERTIAARDAAGVTGVVRVINAINLGSPLAPNPSATALTAPQPAIPVPTPAPATTTRIPLPVTKVESASQRREDQIRAQQLAESRQPAPITRSAPPSSYQPVAPPPQPVAPPPPPPPAFRTVTVASGRDIPVRINQTLDSATAQAGTTFSGTVETNVMADGAVAIPAGATVTGLISDVKDAAHFKGASMLTITLSTVNRRGEHVAVTTDPYTVEGKGRGTNTAEKVGGGAAVGAILGGIFGGGKGAAIGAAAGGGTGAGVQAVTRGQQVQIPSESVVRFHLASPITVRVRNDGGTDRDSGPSGLQHHDQ